MLIRKLNATQIEDIRTKYSSDKVSVRKLAREYGVSHMTIHRIVYDKQPQTPHDVYVERFWAYVDVRGKDDCWHWTGGVSGNGYGSFSYRGKSVRAHKFAYEATYGVCVPSHLHMCHSCDVTTCCNPKHLSVDTPAKNTHEMIERHRKYLGGSKPKLDIDDELELHFLRELKRDGSDRPRYTHHELSNYAGVTGSTLQKTLTKDPIELQRQYLERERASND